MAPAHAEMGWGEMDDAQMQGLYDEMEAESMAEMGMSPWLPELSVNKMWQQLTLSLAFQMDHFD